MTHIQNKDRETWHPIHHSSRTMMLLMMILTETTNLDIQSAATCEKPILGSFSNIDSDTALGKKELHSSLACANFRDCIAVKEWQTRAASLSTQHEIFSKGVGLTAKAATAAGSSAPLDGSSELPSPSDSAIVAHYKCGQKARVCSKLEAPPVKNSMLQLIPRTKGSGCRTTDRLQESPCTAPCAVAAPHTFSGSLAGVWRRSSWTSGV